MMNKVMKLSEFSSIDFLIELRKRIKSKKIEVSHADFANLHVRKHLVLHLGTGEIERDE